MDLKLLADFFLFEKLVQKNSKTIKIVTEVFLNKNDLYINGTKYNFIKECYTFLDGSEMPEIADIELYINKEEKYKAKYYKLKEQYKNAIQELNETKCRLDMTMKNINSFVGNTFKE